MNVITVLTFLGVIALVVQALTDRRSLMAQIDDLRAAIAQVSTDLQEATARVLAKIAELGEPDADLSADIAALGQIGSDLDALVAGPVPPPEPVS